MKIVVNLRKSYFFGIVFSILFLAGLIMVYAYNSNPANPAVFGHSAGELEGGGGGIPSGAIMAFNVSACPQGWTSFGSLNGRVLRGASAPGIFGGNDTHRHDVSLTYFYNVDGGSWRTPVATVNVLDNSSWPPYYNVLYCIKD
jgi:hypothetical protein